MRPRPDVGDPLLGVAPCRNDDGSGLVPRCTERVPEVVGGDAPRIRRQVDQRVDQGATGALPRELADQAV